MFIIFLHIPVYCNYMYFDMCPCIVLFVHHNVRSFFFLAIRSSLYIHSCIRWANNFLLLFFYLHFFHVLLCQNYYFFPDFFSCLLFLFFFLSGLFLSCLILSCILLSCFIYLKQNIKDAKCKT